MFGNASEPRVFAKDLPEMEGFDVVGSFFGRGSGHTTKKSTAVEVENAKTAKHEIVPQIDNDVQNRIEVPEKKKKKKIRKKKSRKELCKEQIAQERFPAAITTAKKGILMNPKDIEMHKLLAMAERMERQRTEHVSASWLKRRIRKNRHPVLKISEFDTSKTFEHTEPMNASADIIPRPDPVNPGATQITAKQMQRGRKAKDSSMKLSDSKSIPYHVKKQEDFRRYNKSLQRLRTTGNPSSSEMRTQTKYGNSGNQYKQRIRPSTAPAMLSKEKKVSGKSGNINYQRQRKLLATFGIPFDLESKTRRYGNDRKAFSAQRGMRPSTSCSPRKKYFRGDKKQKSTSLSPRRRSNNSRFPDVEEVYPIKINSHVHLPHLNIKMPIPIQTLHAHHIHNDCTEIRLSSHYTNISSKQMSQGKTRQKPINQKNAEQRELILMHREDCASHHCMIWGEGEAALRAHGFQRNVYIYLASVGKGFEEEHWVFHNVVVPLLNRRLKEKNLCIHVQLKDGSHVETSLNLLENMQRGIKTCKPFYVALIGEEYGWIPDTKLCGANGVRSLFHMTIKAMNRSALPSHRFIYNRILKNNTKISKENSNLNLLEIDIKSYDEKFSKSCRNTYECRQGALNEVNSIDRLSLNTLASIAIDDIFEALQYEFGFDCSPCTYGLPGNYDSVKTSQSKLEVSGHKLLIQESFLHQHLVSQYTSQYVPYFSDDFNDRVVDEIMDELWTAGEHGKPLVWERPLNLAGIGVTTLCAKIAHVCPKVCKEKERNSVISLSHFVGASPNSYDCRRMLFRLCFELQARFEICVNTRIPGEYSSLRPYFFNLLDKVALKAERDNLQLLICIDDAHKLSVPYKSEEFDWIPYRFRNNGHIMIMITMPMGKLPKGKPETAVFDIKHLLPSGKTLIKFSTLVVKSLIRRSNIASKSLFHRNIDNTLISLIDMLSNTEFQNITITPLYLEIATYIFFSEDLGVSRKSFPNSLDGIINCVITHFEETFGYDVTCNLFSLIHLSLFGIFTCDIPNILKIVETSRKQSYTKKGLLDALISSMQGFLQLVELSPYPNMLCIHHERISQIIEAKYLGGPGSANRDIYVSALVQWCRSVSDPYCDYSFRKPNPYALQVYPFYLCQLQDPSKMGFLQICSVFCNLRFLKAYIVLDGASVYELIDHFQYLLPNILAKPNLICESFINSEKLKPLTENVITSENGTRTKILPDCLRSQRGEIVQGIQKYLTSKGNENSKPVKSAIPKMLRFPEISIDNTLKRFTTMFTKCITEHFFFLRERSIELNSSPTKIFQQALGSQGISSIAADFCTSTLESNIDTFGACPILIQQKLLCKDTERKDAKHVYADMRMNVMCMSPNKAQALIGFENANLQIITIDETMTVDKSLEGHTSGITSVSWCRECIASGDRAGDILIWNSPEYELTSRIDGGHSSSSVSDISLTYNGLWIVSVSSDSAIRFWNCKKSSEQVTSWSAAYELSQFTAVDFSPFGDKCAVGNITGNIILFDTDHISGSKIVIEIKYTAHHLDRVTSLTWHQSNDVFCTTSLDGCAMLWSTTGNMFLGKNPNNGGCICVLREDMGHSRGLLSAAFNDEKEGELITCGLDNSILLWDIKKCKVIRSISGHNDAVSGCDFLHDGTITSCSHDTTVRLFLHTGMQLGSSSDKRLMLNGKTHKHSNRVMCCKVSHDSRYVACGSLDLSLHLWDIQLNQLACKLKGHIDSVLSIAFASPQKGGEIILFSGGDDVDSKIVAWKFSTAIQSKIKKQPHASLLASELSTMAAHNTGITCLVVNEDRLISGDKNSLIAIWGSGSKTNAWSNPEKLYNVNLKFGPISSFVLSTNSGEDGSYLVVMNDVGVVNTHCVDLENSSLSLRNATPNWNASNHPKLRGRLSAMCIAADGNLIAIGDDISNIAVWNTLSLARKPEISTLPGAFAGHSAAISTLAFSPNLMFLVSGGYDQRMMLWCPLTGYRYCEYKFYVCITAIFVSSDNKTLTCGDDTGNIYIMQIYEPLAGLGQINRIFTMNILYQRWGKVVDKFGSIISCSDSKSPKQNKKARKGRKRSIGWAVLEKKIRSRAKWKRENNSYLIANLSRSEDNEDNQEKRDSLDIIDLFQQKGMIYNRFIIDAQSRLKLTFWELRDFYITSIASKIHENHRKLFLKFDGTYTSNKVIVGGKSFDFSNLSFEDLPCTSQYRLLEVATAAVNVIMSHFLQCCSSEALRLEFSILPEHCVQVFDQLSDESIDTRLVNEALNLVFIEFQNNKK